MDSAAAPKGSMIRSILNISAIILFSILSFYSTPVRADRVTSSDLGVNRKIDGLCISINSDRNYTHRVQTAKMIFDTVVIAVKDKIVIDENSIGKLSELLKDKDDAIRGFAAMALGEIGPPASSALPALRAALEDAQPIAGSDVIGPDLGSDGAIRAALAKITGHP